MKIYYKDLWGLREEKYDFLKTHDVKNTDWQELELREPNCFFVPKDVKGEEKYNNFISVRDIFEYSQAGVTTGNDRLFVDKNIESLKARIRIIFDKTIDENQLNLSFQLQKSQAGRKLIANRTKCDFSEELFRLYSYRIFDSRYLYSENKFLWRSVEKLQEQFISNNLALVTTKSLSTKFFQHVMVTEHIGDYSFISDKTREVNYYFPLFLYGESNKNVFIGQKHLDLAGVQKSIDESGKRSNIRTEIINQLSNSYKKKITSEEFFHYIYAVLYSNKYRQKYNEFLKIDFPRIPFTKNYELFQKFSNIGKELAGLHLMKSQKLEKSIAKFPATGDNLVEKREYRNQRIYINGSQYFEGAEDEVWNYYIGGYQVLDKWLKDKVDQTLSSEDVDHYLNIISSVYYTIELQKEIDKLYPEVEKSLMK